MLLIYFSALLGPSLDQLDAVDEYLAEAAGSIAALLSALGQETKAAAVVAATIASYLPFPFVGNLGELALFALGETSEGELAVAMALGVVPGGKLAHMFAKSGLGSFIGKIGSSAWSSAKHYAGKAGSILGRGARGLVDRAGQFLRRKPGSACGCFTAGTIVWTLTGLVPIEQVNVGDVVFTLDEDTGAMVLGTVTDQFVTEGAALLELTVRHASGRLETIETTDEHPFWREADGDAAEGWARADALSPGDRVRTLSGSAIVERIRFGSERTTVYNLSISADPSYLIGDDGVWVHNTRCRVGNVNKIAQAFSTTVEKVKEAIHRIKSRGSAGSGGAGRRNPDLEVDLDTGDVFIKGTDEHIDNILDHL